jgi:hypothetical protein
MSPMPPGGQAGPDDLRFNLPFYLLMAPSTDGAMIRCMGLTGSM